MNLYAEIDALLGATEDAMADGLHALLDSDQPRARAVLHASAVRRDRSTTMLLCSDLAATMLLASRHAARAA